MTSTSPISEFDRIKWLKPAMAAAVDDANKYAVAAIKDFKTCADQPGNDPKTTPPQTSSYPNLGPQSTRYDHLRYAALRSNTDGKASASQGVTSDAELDETDSDLKNVASKIDDDAKAHQDFREAVKKLYAKAKAEGREVTREEREAIRDQFHANIGRRGKHHGKLRENRDWLERHRGQYDDDRLQRRRHFINEYEKRLAKDACLDIEIDFENSFEDGVEIPGISARNELGAELREYLTELGLLGSSEWQPYLQMSDPLATASDVVSDGDGGFFVLTAGDPDSNKWYANAYFSEEFDFPMTKMWEKIIKEDAEKEADDLKIMIARQIELQRLFKQDIARVERAQDNLRAIKPENVDPFERARLESNKAILKAQIGQV